MLASHLLGDEGATALQYAMHFSRIVAFMTVYNQRKGCIWKRQAAKAIARADLQIIWSTLYRHYLHPKGR